MLKYLWRGFLLSILSIVLLFAWSAWQVYDYSRPNTNASGQVAIVLGAAAWGKLPSPVFRERINHALTLYQNHRVEKLLFTGGTPKAGFDTEAEVARRFAIKQGIPADDILFETTSKDTYQNLVNARTLMRKHHITDAVLISDPYHMARARAMALNLGINATLSPTPTSRFKQADKKIQHKFFLQESYSLFIYRLLLIGNWGLKKSTLNQ
ncbi:MAG: YdcF family protein [Neisseriaceae bacterium]|nr:YdcF family protein [Neisseriaceae bacterium]